MTGSATKQSILAARWIASRSLSSGAHSRDPLARNDGGEGATRLSFVERHALWSAEQKEAASRLRRDRKSTRLNSSHSQISYAVFCLKKKKKNDPNLAL